MTEILKHGLQVPICGLQVPICGSAPQMSSPRSEQKTRAATIFAYTHTHTTIQRCGCSSRRASSRAASKSSAFVFDSIADDWDSTENSPAAHPLSLLVFFLKIKQSQIPFFLQLNLGCVLEQWRECRGAGACYAVCRSEVCVCVEIFCC